MQIGCGFRINEVHGRESVYFWHYGDRGGRSRQLYAYMEARRSCATAQRLPHALEA